MNTNPAYLLTSDVTIDDIYGVMSATMDAIVKYDKLTKCGSDIDSRWEYDEFIHWLITINDLTYDDIQTGDDCVYPCMKIIFNNNGQEYTFYFGGEYLMSLNDNNYSPYGINMTGGFDYYWAVEHICRSVVEELEYRHDYEAKFHKSYCA